MIATYGVQRPAASAGGATARLTLRDGPLDLGWVHCGITAEFLGNLVAGLAAKSGVDANEARHSVSYLANELLENAVKFRAEGAGDVTIEMRFADTTFELLLANFAPAKNAVAFQAFLAEVETRDAGELLIERIEANAADDSSNGSGLGILTLMNDYGARLGWRFEQQEEGEPVRVEIYAALTLSRQQQSQ
jgi:hypothetical protein